MPTSNAEMEDVLSSIRRLIDGRNKAAQESDEASSETTPDASAEPQASSPERTALILSPALRVANAPEAPDSQSSKAQDAPVADEAGSDNSTEPTVETARDTSERAPSDAARAAAQALSATAKSSPASEVSGFVNAWSKKSARMPVREDQGRDEKPVVDRSSVLELTEQTESHAPVDDVIAPAEDDETVFPETAAEQEVEDPLPVVEQVSEDAPIKDSAQQGTKPEDARLAEMLDSALAEQLTDAVREQIARSLPQDVAALAPRMLDADLLRPMVNDLIRQELAGPLGERITQSVRKLVRQEIQRAITVRRLE